MDIVYLIQGILLTTAGILGSYDTKLSFKRRPLGTLAGIGFLIAGIMGFVVAFTSY